jgi:hypothetical protein
MIQKAGQKHSIEILNRSFEDVVKVQIFRNNTNKSKCMHEEIKSRLNLENACYDSVQSLLSPCQLSRNAKVKIYKTIILPVVL